MSTDLGRARDCTQHPSHILQVYSRLVKGKIGGLVLVSKGADLTIYVTRDLSYQILCANSLINSDLVCSNNGSYVVQ